MKTTSARVQQIITKTYIILLTTAFLVYTGPQGYTKITASKFSAYFLLTCGYIVIMSILAVMELRGSLSGLIKKLGWAQKSAVLYLALTWVSALASPFWPDTVLGVSRYEGALTITLYVISFLFISIYGKGDRILLWVFAAAVTAESILCIVQMAGYNPFSLYPEGYNYFDAGKAYNGEYLGTIGNVDLLAAFYCLAVPILAYASVRLRGAGRFIILAALSIAVYTAVRMSVMAGFVGITAGLLLALPAGIRERRGRLTLWAGISVLLLAGVLTVYAVDLPIGPLHEAHSLLHGNLDGGFGSGRIHIWSEVLRTATQRPLLGFGPDTMINGGLEPFTRYSGELGGTIVAVIDTAHNEYLNIWYHQGIFALGAYIWLLALLWRRWIKTAPAAGSQWALGAGIIGYCAQAFFGFSMCITAPFFWAALGLLDAGSRQVEEVKT